MHAAGVLEICRRPKEQSVDDREYRDVGAQPEPEGQHDGQHESRSFARASYGVPHVLRERFEPCDPARIAGVVLDPFDSTECTTRAQLGLGSRHPLANVLLGLALQVKANLVVELLLDFGTPEQRAKPHQVMSNTSPTAAVSFAHASTSSPSCFRPARVSS